MTTSERKTFGQVKVRKSSANPEKEQDHLVAKVRQVLHVKEAGRWHLLKVIDESGKEIILKGVATTLLRPGSTIECKVDRSTWKAIGLITEMAPKDTKSIEAYLQSHIEGVGKEMARRLVEKFGEKTLDIIEKTPDQLLTIQGISKKKLESIVHSYHESVAERRLMQMLGKYDIGPKTVWKIYDKYRDRAAEVIRTNPYRLTEIRGIGFRMADSIAMSAGFSELSPERLIGAVKYMFHDEIPGRGETVISESQLIDEVIKLAKLPVNTREPLGGIIAGLETEGIIERRTNQNLISLRHIALQERQIARHLARLADIGEDSERAIANKRFAGIAASLASELGDADQIEAVRQSFLSQVSVITGRPGCGKTTVTRYIVNAAEHIGLGPIVFCAPTGKAARRLAEATEREAKTIHSTLGYSEGGFLHHESNPLDGRMFVIDESSMIDSSLALSLLRAIPRGARVVLIGDVDQLPSVGAGNVLRDIIRSGCVHISTLKTIHRTAKNSDIVVNAHRIIDGDIRGVDLAGDRDFRFTEIAINEEEVGEITLDERIVATVLEKYRELSAIHGQDSVQVLAARRGTGSGVNLLNQKIRDIVNPPAAQKPRIDLHGMSFRLHDRVMQTVNSSELGVSNGEIGVVTAISEEEKLIHVDFGDRIVRVGGKDAANLDHAYATTIHKSQGSEFPAVIMVAPNSHAFMMNRNLLYTGITRGKKHVEIIGTKKCVRSGIAKPGNERETGLEEEVRMLLGGQPVRQKARKQLFA